jgi:hypothetical protein
MSVVGYFRRSPEAGLSSWSSRIYAGIGEGG